jgi:hypothetical protein
MTSPVRPAEFCVSGDWRDYQAPDTDGTVNTPHVGGPHAFVTFTARLPAGMQLYVDDFDLDGVSRPTGLLLPPIRVRMWAGQLRTINQPNTPDVYLVANDPMLHLTERLAEINEKRVDTLIYDVAFTNVEYAGSPTMKITNFAFTAPVDATPVCITDPDTPRIRYDPIP